MKVANIVSTSKVEAPEEFNVVKTINNVIDGLPTLIIGYDYVDKNYPDFDILNICLGENLYWTFKRTEKRDKFQEDLNWFISKVYSDLTKQIIYVFVDPIQYKKNTLIKIIRKIYSLEKPITYINGEMAYIYGEYILFGVDLKLLRYMGLNVDKIKDKFKKISHEFLTDTNILIEYKKNVEALGNQVRYIPYLYHIRNAQNDSSRLIHIPRKG